MAGQRRANQADIAEHLGVSVSTVSRALANEAGISEAVRRDVQRVALMLGYKSKHTPLPTAEDKRAVALVPLGGATGNLTSFYFGIVEGMRFEAAQCGIALDVRLVNELSVTLEFIQRQITKSDATGLLLAGIDASDELIAYTAEAGISTVLVNGTDPKMRLSSVAPANFFGAYMATKRLLDAGHRRILHYTFRQRPTIRERLRGFERAIADTPGAVGTVVNAADASTDELMRDIQARKYDVTAIFVWNDAVAVQMLEELLGEENPMPPGFSIIGFDDLPIAGIATPRLSTMHVNRAAIGRSAIRLLAQQLTGEDAVQQLEVGVTPIDGETIFQLSS